MGKEIYDANNLYSAFLASKKGSAWKGTVQKFGLNWMREIFELQKELESREYRTGEQSSFVLNERGHTRLIVGNNIRDRVVRHSLCDNVLLPAVSSYLIHANGASQKGKGISFQRKQLLDHLRRYYINNGSNEGHILLMDFSKYYDNIDHKTALDMLKRVVNDKRAMWLLELIFKDFEVDASCLPKEALENPMGYKYDSLTYWNQEKSTEPGNKIAKSVNIGDQTSQVISIFYPTPIDNYVKIVRGIKYYGRYMDDSYIISNNKEELLSVLEGVRKQCNELGVFLNEKKTKIVKLSHGFRFLQVQYTLTETGRIMQKIHPKRVTAMRRKLKKLKRKIDEGKCSFEDVDNMFRSWMGGYRKLLSKQQKYNLNSLYYDLFKEYRRKQDGQLQNNSGERNGNSERHHQWKQLYRSERVPTECIDPLCPYEGYGQRCKWEDRRLWGKYDAFEFLGGE